MLPRPTRSCILSVLTCLIGTLACRAGDFYALPSSTVASDDAPGDRDHPWKTLKPANLRNWSPGDTLYLESGATFSGTLALTAEDSGTAATPVRVTSLPGARATIDGGNAAAITLTNASFLEISRLVLRGNGRKTGNTADGLRAQRSSQLSLALLDISGFQHSGLLLEDCSHVRATRLDCHDNGMAGIQTRGTTWNDPAKYGVDFYFGYCRAYNNPGDPTVLTNHSGNGILLGQVNGALVEYCTAANNGGDMPNSNVNGPAGIWAWQSDHVVFDRCLAHDNKTMPGKVDGDGFDFDGGVRFSTMRRCLSYGNDGPGFLLFQGSWATTWQDNVLHHNVSIDDGATNSPAGVVVYHDGGVMNGAEVHHNTLINRRTNGTAVYFNHPLPNGKFVSNVFASAGPLLYGAKVSNCQILGNLYWREAGFLCDGYSSLGDWSAATGKELLSGALKGLVADPVFAKPLGSTFPTEVGQLPFWADLRPGDGSPLAGGSDVSGALGLLSDSGDFSGNDSSLPHIGAFSTGTQETGRLVNVSTRAALDSGAQAVIAGFVVAGPRTKSLLVRAAGPSLSDFLPGFTVANNPTLSLHRVDETGDHLLSTATGWSRDLESVRLLEESFALCGAFSWQRGSAEAALLAELPAGNYTAVVSNDSGSSGVTLVEVYEGVVETSATRLSNLSTRSWVGPADGVQIAGFVVSGDQPRSYLIRAAGPALSPFLGSEVLLQNPRLQVFHQTAGGNELIVENEDWSTEAGVAESVRTAAAACGAFPFPEGGSDAAAVVQLSPGNYTAVVSPGDGAAGIGLVEVYQIP